MILQNVDYGDGNSTLVILSNLKGVCLSWKCICWEINKCTKKIRLHLKIEMPNEQIFQRARWPFRSKWINAKVKPIYWWVDEHDIHFIDVYQHEYEKLED